MHDEVHSGDFFVPRVVIINQIAGHDLGARVSKRRLRVDAPSQGADAPSLGEQALENLCADYSGAADKESCAPSAMGGILFSH